MKSVTTLLTATLLLTVTLAHAQERAAGSTLETQMTWSALSSQISTLKTQVTGVDTRVGVVDQRLSKVEYCNKQGLVYSPGTAGADGHGCITAGTAPSITNTINNILTCSKAGQVYNGTTCTTITSDQVATGTISIDYKACSFATNTHDDGRDDGLAGRMLGIPFDTQGSGRLYCPSNYVLIGTDNQTVGAALCCKLKFTGTK